MAPAGGAEAGAPASSVWMVHIVLVLVQCLSGGAYVISKFALTTGVNPIVLAVYRDIVALCALGPVAYFAERGKRPSLDLTTICLFVVLGVIGIFAAQLLLLFGLKLATASLSSVVSISIPVCVFFISAVFGLEDIKWRRFDGLAKVSGLVSAVIGAVLTARYRGPAILGVPSPASQCGAELLLPLDGIENWQIGVIFLFLAGMSIAVFITLQTPTLKRFPAPISMSAIAYFFGAVTLGILGAIVVPDSSEWAIFNNPSVIISTVYLGVLVSGANYALQAWAIQRVGPVLVASYTPLQPFFTSFLALIFIGEKIYLGSVLGALLIITGLYLITVGKIRSRKLAAESGAGLLPRDGPPTSKATSDLQQPLLA